MEKRLINIGILGFGTVGSGAVKVLWEQKEEIEKELGVELRIKKIVDQDWQRQRPVAVPPELKGKNLEEVLEDPELDILVEAIGGVEPAFSIVSRFLSRGKTVITPNKELIAKKGRELLDLASQAGGELFFEGSVGGGIPIIQTLKTQLLGDDISEVFGIVNGTTNFILTHMSLYQSSYAESLDKAQELGYAEPVPTMDVEGFDAAYKIAILASLSFHTRVDVESVYREGITRIIPQDIEFAQELGFVVKLLAIAKLIDNAVTLRVHPVFLPNNHPLSGVNGVENAIFVKSRFRELTFRGPGAGGEATGAALVGDIIEAVRNILFDSRGRVGCTCLRELEVQPIAQLETQYCIRVLALDVPGVLGKIATEFGDGGVSLSAVKQPVSTPGKLTNIYFLTHSVREELLQKALKRVNGLEVVSDTYTIRVEA